MKKLNLRTKTRRQYIEIPVDFIDEYMPQAPEGALKLYLYLLRCAADTSILLSLSDMADLFDMTNKAVIRSLSYWEDCGLLALEYSGEELEDITILPVNEPKASALPKPPHKAEQEPAKPSSAILRLHQDGEEKPVPEKISAIRQETAPLPPEIHAADLDNDEEFVEFLSLAQYYIKEPVSPALRDQLAYCYLLFDRQIDLTTFLLEYCIGEGHRSGRYIRSVAEGWKKEGLSSLGLSDLKHVVGQRSRSITKLLKAYGIRNRTFTDSEMEYVSRWLKMFDADIIAEACRRTIINIHEPSLKYTDAILSSWKEEKVSSLKDIQALDESHARKEKSEKTASGKGRSNSFLNFTERDDSYDDVITKYYES